MSHLNGYWAACFHTNDVTCDNCRPRKLWYDWIDSGRTTLEPYTTVTIPYIPPPTDLQRIANALERIAAALEKQTEIGKKDGT